MNYTRVIPRDLFNEAKLLKCMGQLVLKIEDRMTPVPMEVVDETGDPFEISLREDGVLVIDNIKITVKGKCLPFGSTYNSKSPYPLCCGIYMDTDVFDDNGEFTKEFITLCQEL